MKFIQTANNVKFKPFKLSYHVFHKNDKESKTCNFLLTAYEK